MMKNHLLHPKILGALASAGHSSGVKLRSLERFKFYEEASSPDVCLTIATGEDRIYANLLLTIGVIR